MIAATHIVLAAMLAFSTVSTAAAVPTDDLVRRDYSAAGWHSRAEPHPAGSSYQVNKQNLVFGLGRSTRLEPEGSTHLKLCCLYFNLIGTLDRIYRGIFQARCSY